MDIKYYKHHKITKTNKPIIVKKGAPFLDSTCLEYEDVYNNDKFYIAPFVYVDFMTLKEYDLYISVLKGTMRTCLINGVHYEVLLVGFFTNFKSMHRNVWEHSS